VPSIAWKARALGSRPGVLENLEQTAFPAFFIGTSGRRSFEQGLIARRRRRSRRKEPSDHPGLSAFIVLLVS
jgi:hypothetical protein